MPGYNDNSEMVGGVIKTHVITGEVSVSPVLIQALPPTLGTVTASTTAYQASIPFTAPTVDPNYPIISYTAISNQGGFSNTVFQSGSGTITITGLTKGSSYQFVVYSDNGFILSKNSDPSNAITAIKVPDAPTGVTATATGLTTANVSYTAPADDGGATITSFTAVSSPGGITATVSTSSSGNISLTGLTAATQYTFNVYATNIIGNSANSTTAAIWTDAVPSQVLFTSTGTTTWTVPNGVVLISAVAIGGGGGGGGGRDSGAGNIMAGGGGGGGGLDYLNNFSVTPGEILTIFIGNGGPRGFNSASTGGAGTAGNLSGVYRGATSLVRANGGSGGAGSPNSTTLSATGGLGGNGINTGNTTRGGRGGNSYGDGFYLQWAGGGGGGAGGYTGVGGNGGQGSVDYGFGTYRGAQGNGGGGGGGATTHNTVLVGRGGGTMM